LIVCSQATKRLALALRPDGSGVPDLDGLAGDDHAVDEQFQQLPPTPEVRPLQAMPHAPAERLGMGREASGFGLAVGVTREFAFLTIERQQPTFSVLPAALVLAQRHHAGEIGLGQPLDLLLQPCPGTAQVSPPCLHFLWQPVPAASPLHRMRDHVRRGEHLTQVAPDQFLEGPARNTARRAAFARCLRGGLRPGPTDVVVVTPPHVPACAGLAAMATADEAA
jgi:hypothetical protein